MADLNTTDFSLPKRMQAGANNPPSDTEWLGENLTLRNVALIRQVEADVALAAQIPAEFSEENEASFTADFIKRVEKLAKEIERRRKDEKDPFLRQGQFVDSFFGDMSEKIIQAVTKAKRPLNDWLTRKARAEQEMRESYAKDARERQEAALRAATVVPANNGIIQEGAVITTGDAIQNLLDMNQQVRVADALAAAPVTSMAATTGAVSRAALATKWVGEIKDVDQLDLHKLRPYIAAAELQKALDRFVKQGGRQCDGCEIKEIVEAKVK